MEKLIRREYSGLELAIVGIECKFPGSNNLDEFWKNICEGKELISFFTQEELLAEEVSERMSMYENYVKASGYISGKECFDSNFFGYTSTEARLMNPQMRMLHEGVWNALEDSGYDPSKYEGKIGLFAGAAKNYVNEISGIIKDKETNQKGVMSRHLYNVNFMCSRIAYNLNLQGPAVFVDTACSSSLVSVHLASNSILLGECDIAIAGGIRLFENSKSGYLYEPGGINSDDGHCRAFDEKANGTIPGEGMGLVVIKKLKNAIEDGDNIYAIIKGTAINNDGKGKVGYTAPSIHGQIDIIRKSLKRAKVVPNTIKYIEGHGTGTTLGDSIELQALNQIFKNNIEDKILLGSVKTNIGHLDFAAGIAGLIKTALVVKNKKVPPTVHFNKLNPNVLESTFPLMVNSELITIKSNNAPVRAGVSAFGIGGTNAHIVLEEPPILKHTVDEDENRLLLLSAHSSQALENRRNDILDFLKANNKVSFKDLIYTLQSGRKSLKYRTGYVCKNVQEAIGALSDSIEINKETIKLTNECKQIVFMFSGQGSQYVNMGAELYSEVDYIRELMDKCFDIASTYLDYDIKDILFTEGHDDRDLDEVNNTNNTQPLLFIIEYSLGCWLMELGIKPNFMIGHSLGEYVASCLSGAIDLEDALRLVIMRGKLIWSMPRGSMLSVSLSEDEVMQYLSENVDLAAVNANNLCVLSGKTEAIDSLEIILKQEEVVCKKLVTSHAFHSKMLTPILKDFENEVLKTKFDDIKIPIVSNLTGEFLKQSEISNPKYWSNHLRKTVRFNQGIQKLLKNPNTLFIEIGPGKTLASLLQYNLVGNEQFNKIVTSIRPGNVEENDHRYLLKSLFNIWNAGIELRWEKTFKNSVKRLALPGYPFDNIKYLPYNQNEYVNDHMPNNSINSRINIEEWFYESSWKMKSLFMGNDFDENEKSKKICLVFIEKLDFVEIFLGKLKEQGCNIILVEKGEGFKEYSKKK